MKKTFLAGLALGISALSLAACGDTGTEEVAEAPEGIPGMAVENARMVLAPVAGNPAAVYFDLKYDGEQNVALRAADVAGAGSTMMHDYGEWDGKVQMMEMLPLVIQPGETVKFEPGSRHVMAMDVSPELQPGGETEVTLMVAGGDKFSFPAEIRAAGEDR